MQCFLGIDLGTSAVKAQLIDEEQLVLASSSIPLDISNPHPLWSEQDPQQWWKAVDEAVLTLFSTAKRYRGSVAAIGLTGQMHGAILLDRHLRPIRPAILWNDGRAHKEARMLAALYPDLSESLGVLPMAGLTAPKILWLETNEPKNFGQIKYLLAAKDYIRLKLTGVIATDYSDAGGTWLFDQQAKSWSEKAVEAIHLNLQQLPQLTESTTISGEITADIASRWGVAKRTIVAGGGGDTPVGAVGCGCIYPQRAVISLGTSAHICSPTIDYRPAVKGAVHSFCHAVPDLWYQMGALLNGASTFQWFGKILGEKIAKVDRQVARLYKGPGDIFFLPYLSGERTPHNDPYAKGVFLGLNSNTSREELAQAIFEGVAYSLADARDCLLNSGTLIKTASIGGGGAQSNIWTKIIATVLDIPLERHGKKMIGPAFGAARIAQLATNLAPMDVICRVPPPEEIVEPDKRYTEEYRLRLKKFRRIYQKLRSEFLPL